VSDLTNRFGEMPEDALSAYLDGELTPDARAAVEARLDASPEWRAILADVRVARDAVRQLPTAAPPEGFWERVRAEVGGADEASVVEAPVVEGADDVVVDLDAARARRDGRRSRWVAALGSAAAAAVVAAVIITPSTDRVKPAVATLSNAHAVRSSTSQDPVGSLASVGKVTGFRR
jgi:anti-sigma factor RsiW